MVDCTVMHRRWHVWPSPASVLGLALATSKACGLRPRHARPSTPAENRHTAAKSTVQGTGLGRIPTPPFHKIVTPPMARDWTI
jgi:hypothetical protein